MRAAWMTRSLVRLIPLVLCSATFASGCVKDHVTPPTPADKEAYDVIWCSSYDKPTPANAPQPLPPGAYHSRRFWQTVPRPRVVTVAVRTRLDTILSRWVRDSSLTKMDTVVVTFTEHIRVPRFPEPDPMRSRSSAFNVAALDQARLLIQNVMAKRDSQYLADTTDMKLHYGASILKTHWIAPVVEAVMPIGKADSLSHRHDVVAVQRKRSERPPPQDSNPNNDPVKGRDSIGSDPYFNLGLSYGWMSLLDTGVHAEHAMFAGTPSPFGRLGDCVAGTFNPITLQDCNGGYSDDIATDHGHGTGDAALLVGNPVHNPTYRGITGAALDCFRVYYPDASKPFGCALDRGAAIAGFATATARLDRVIVAEMQEFAPEMAGIAVAAQNAYDAGATIIGAIGNGGPSMSAPSDLGIPGSAPCAIGVGAVDLETGSQVAGQSWGMTVDNRFKPDLQAPTSTETASNDPATTANPAPMTIANGTSGSTPYAAGAAALLRNWLTKVLAGPVADVGQIYAQLILSGPKAGHPMAANKTGVGSIVLPSGGRGCFGKVILDSDHDYVDVPITVATGDKRVDAAIWWPETLANNGTVVSISHNDIDLEIRDPSHAMMASSIGPDGVYERATFSAMGLTAGSWTLRIRAQALTTMSQTVFWTAGMTH